MIVLDFMQLFVTPYDLLCRKVAYCRRALPKVFLSPFFFIPLVFLFWCSTNFFLLRTSYFSEDTLRTSSAALSVQEMASGEDMASAETSSFKPAEMIYHHIQDAHVWHFWEGTFGVLYLPVILYSSNKGVLFFSSRRFFNEADEPVDYRGYRLLANGKRIQSLVAGERILDFSITKNVLTLFILAFIIFFVFYGIARSYARKGALSVPRGIQNFMEPIILFVTNEVVRPCIGERSYRKYLPYLLTLFFFILFGNIMGLLPGAANLTGNIAVTMTLALFTFFITNFSGNRHYWNHVFNTPGVPLFIKPLIVSVEFIGIFTKPISLMVRLFVAMTAGHIVILSLLGLAFLFKSYAVGVLSALVVVFINGIELLVSVIQAYVFTMFSSLYIGMAVGDGEH